jgi:cytochrome b subunit of formate dehydrogenase
MVTSEQVKTKVVGSRGLAEAYFVRFSVAQRIEHAILMVTFTALAVTGLAQRFYTSDWAEWIVLQLGGIDNVLLIHRAFGFLFVLSLLYHFAYVGHALLVRRASPSMLPSLKDARDMVGTLKYSFGFADKAPEYGRFDYRQKFEYWGIIFGGLMMALTGFMLAFPLVFTEVLPGQFIAAAKEAHRNEAMLAVFTIVLWHFYDVFAKPGIFPGDLSIFTGRISRKRMMHEHSLEYNEVMESSRPAESDEGSPKEPPLESHLT